MNDERKQGPTNVEVVVRCRPLIAREQSEGTPAVVSVTSKTDVCVRHIVDNKLVDKKYAFGRAFGQHTTQAQVFDAVVSPLIDQVLEGMNCTVFAYGQTGTGKTYTMEGQMDSDELAGIIPRSVKAVFKHLEDTGVEHSVKLSFLELYNERLADLLAKKNSEKRLRIVDDARRGVLCRGLEEVLVHDLAEVQKVMASALSKRCVAATMMGRSSSRSHCIFTLTIHKKETTPDGEDLIKVGELNLVDLAGSECVGRSGVTNKRLVEARNINRSLLSLGHVITALVEHRRHIPYRDSKLTRLLRESLGGRAKTCIIATLSPSVMCVEETLSTLEYAQRAKNIKNKPTVNQTMVKREP